MVKDNTAVEAAYRDALARLGAAEGGKLRAALSGDKEALAKYTREASSLGTEVQELKTDLSDDASRDLFEEEIDRKYLLRGGRCKNRHDFQNQFKQEIKDAISDNKPFDTQGKINQTESLLAASNELKTRTGEAGLTNNNLLSIAPKLDTDFAKNAVKPDGNADRLHAAAGILAESLSQVDGKAHTLKEACNIMKDKSQLKAAEDHINSSPGMEGRAKLHLEEYYKHTTKEFQQMHEMIKAMSPEERAKTREMLHEIRVAGNDEKKLKEIQEKAKLADPEFGKYEALVKNYSDWYAQNYDANGNSLKNAQSSLKPGELQNGSLPGRSGQMAVV